MSGSGRAVPGPHTSASVMAGEGEGGGHASPAASPVTPVTPKPFFVNPVSPSPFLVTPLTLDPSSSPPCALVRRLKAENGALVRRLVELKEGEIERMNEINKLHEEAVSASVCNPPPLPPIVIGITLVHLTSPSVHKGTIV